MSGFLHTKKAEPRIVSEVLQAEAGAGVEVTNLATGNLNQAYRIANFSSNQVDLQDFTNGVAVSVKSTVDGDTGTIQLWGYPVKGGAAQFYGEYTFTTDSCVDDDGLFYVEAFVVTANASQHPTDIYNLADGMATIEFDTKGLRYLVALTLVATSGNITVEARPW